MVASACGSDIEMSFTSLAVGHLRKRGFEDVRPSPELLGEDLALDISVEIAFGRMDGLFPAVVEEALRTYEDTWLSRSGVPWPFAVEEDPDGLLGRRARYVGAERCRIVAMLCVVSVIDRWMAASSSPPPVLGIGGSHG